MVRPTVVCVLLAFWSTSLAVRAEDPAPIPELKVLEDYVGTWEEVMTNKPTELMPRAERQVSTTKKSWTLGGRHIRMEGTWNPGKNEFLSLLTFDPATKEYRTWYFDSGGGIPRGDMHGTWDERTRTMTWKSTDEFGNKTVGKTRLVDRDHHEWTVVMTDPNGKVLLDLQAKNTRK